MIVLAIDPGSERSAFVILDTGWDELLSFDTWTNEGLVSWLRNVAFPVPRGPTQVIIEKVEGFGMAVGAETFETVFWSGRFAEAAYPLPVHRIGRKAVKLHLCGETRAKDPNVRQALIDRYGGTGGKDAAIGRKGARGPLYGVSKDVWAALAVAVTWADQQQAAA